jgi:hypothetical protein
MKILIAGGRIQVTVTVTERAPDRVESLSGRNVCSTIFSG